MARRGETQVGFVGRTDDLAALRRHLDDTSEGRPHTVCLYGQAGIGKTRLVREFLRRSATGHQVVWASASESETDLTFGVTDQIFAALPRAGSAQAGQAAPGRRQPLDPTTGHLIVGSTLLEAVGALTRPAVLVVDDFHWADRSSSDALLFLLRRLRVEPVLTVLTTHRFEAVDGQVPADRPHAGWWRFLRDPANATLLPVGGLDPDDLAELATTLGHTGLPGATVRSLHEHTGGHPLHFRSLLEEVGVQGLALMPDPPPAPRSLTSLVRARFQTLSPAARDMVAAGAVLGQHFAPELAARLAGLDDGAAALDEARDDGILQTGPTGTGFPHALMRSAVYHALTWSTRRALHRAAAGVTTGAVALRHLAAATSGYDEDLAASFAMLALTQVEQGDHRQAADSLLRAARLTEDPAVRDDVLLRAVALLCLSEEPRWAETHRAEVEACADGPRRSLVLGLMAFVAGRQSEAQALLAQAVSAAADQVPGMMRLRAALALALVCVQQGEWEEAIAAADVVEAGHLDWERAVALSPAVLALARLGRTTEATRRATDFLLADPTAPGGVDSQVGLGLALLLDGDPVGAQGELEHAVRRARAGEPSRLTAFALANLGEVHYQLGRWDEAVLDLELAASLAADSSRFDVLTRVHTVLAWIAAGQARFGEAEQHLADAASTPGAATSFGGRSIAISWAVLAAARGDAPGMLVAVAAPFGGQLDAERAMDGMHSWRTVAVEALVRAGPAQEAAAAVMRFAEELPDRPGQPWADDAARLRGDLARAGRDLEGAETAYLQGLGRPAGPLEAGPARARLHAAYGHHLTDLGRRREAIEHLRVAREVFVALKAGPLRERCDEDLVRCGLPLPAARTHEWSLLTPAEARVARLVAQGMSNRATAADLFVSTKTVEYHLGHVFAKLGVTSRSELPQALQP